MHRYPLFLICFLLLLSCNKKETEEFDYTDYLIELGAGNRLLGYTITHEGKLSQKAIFTYFKDSVVVINTYPEYHEQDNRHTYFLDKGSVVLSRLYSWGGFTEYVYAYDNEKRLKSVIRAYIDSTTLPGRKDTISDEQLFFYNDKNDSRTEHVTHHSGYSVYEPVNTFTYTDVLPSFNVNNYFEDLFHQGKSHLILTAVYNAGIHSLPNQTASHGTFKYLFDNRGYVVQSRETIVQGGHGSSTTGTVTRLNVYRYLFR